MKGGYEKMLFRPGEVPLFTIKNHQGWVRGLGPLAPFSTILLPIPAYTFFRGGWPVDSRTLRHRGESRSTSLAFPTAALMGTCT